MMRASMKNGQRGLGAIAAVIVLVAMAALAAAIVRFGSATQAATAQGVMAARALQSARAGAEWGLYQALKGSWTTCSGASQTLDLTGSSGMRVTVSCDSKSFNEGEVSAGTARTVRLYTIDAVACSSATACPDNTAAAGQNYVERRWQVQASDS